MSPFNVLAAIALSAGSICAHAYQMPDANYSFAYQGEIQVQDETSSSYRTLYRPPAMTFDGRSAVAKQTKEKGFPETVAIPNGTLTKNRMEVYGYNLVVTPEKMDAGQFEKAQKVHTRIDLEHSVEGPDGRAFSQSMHKAVDLKVGEETTLDWSSHGAQYRLSLRLLSAQSLAK